MFGEFRASAGELFWMDGPWPGKLALSARPRSGDWLGDEAASWRRAGAGIVVSLLTPEEEHDLDLGNEARELDAQGLEFMSFPIEDRQTPASTAKLSTVIEALDSNLSSGTVAACLLIGAGWDPAIAVRRLSAVRGVPIPETAEQRRWIDQYASTLVSAK